MTSWKKTPVPVPLPDAESASSHNLYVSGGTDLTGLPVDLQTGDASQSSPVLTSNCQVLRSIHPGRMMSVS